MAALAMMVSNEMDKMAALSIGGLLGFANVFSFLYLKLIAFADGLRPWFFLKGCPRPLGRAAGGVIIKKTARNGAPHSGAAF